MTTTITDSTEHVVLEPLLTLKDLERLLRVNERTIYRLCERGQLPRPLKVGAGNRWRAQDIANLIDGKGAAATANAPPEVPDSLRRLAESKGKGPERTLQVPAKDANETDGLAG
jgi:predicted DNA-binding transcriptional regulator AlpA